MAQKLAEIEGAKWELLVAVSNMSKYKIYIYIYRVHLQYLSIISTCVHIYIYIRVYKSRLSIDQSLFL